MRECGAMEFIPKLQMAYVFESLALPTNRSLPLDETVARDVQITTSASVAVLELSSSSWKLANAPVQPRETAGHRTLSAFRPSPACGSSAAFREAPLIGTPAY